MEADIAGLQRKVLTAAVAPVKVSHGESGIALRDGTSLPFRVTRSWSAPAGVYPEGWYLVDPATSEVLYEGPAHPAEPILGLQAPTEVVDEVTEPIPLQPGAYLIVFALGGVKGGELEVQATELPSEEAA